VLAKHDENYMPPGGGATRSKQAGGKHPIDKSAFSGQKKGS
jgi:cytochrome c-type biogenesis protein CcmE